MEAGARYRIEVLRRSHERLAGRVRQLTPEQLRGQSYDTDWSVAQVLSHLGSGAEIALLMLPGALGEGPAVGVEAFQPVWDVWNAKTPDAQAADSLAADERHVRTLEGLTDDQLAAVSLEFAGHKLDAAGVVGMRLGEHALHTWDVEVSVDPAATVSAEAVDLLLDNVPGFLAPRTGKPLAEPFAVRIITTDPARDYLLTSADSVSVTDWPAADPAAAGAGAGAGAAGDTPVVRMPAEALLRLAYGRLDRAHTPAAVSADPAVLDKLRAIFPGF